MEGEGILLQNHISVLYSKDRHTRFLFLEDTPSLSKRTDVFIVCEHEELAEELTKVLLLEVTLDVFV